MSKIISLDISRDASHIIVLDKDELKIIDSINIPTDYKGEDIVELIFSEVVTSFSDDIICYDGNGLGVMITDLTTDNINKKMMNPLNLEDIKNLSQYYLKAKELLWSYMLSKDGIKINGVEFKKLLIEINNLIVKQKPDGNIVIDRKDKNIDRSRAIAFIQGIYMIDKINN